MNRSRIAVAAILAVMTTWAASPERHADMRMTVLIEDRTNIPPAVLVRARHVATKAFAAAGIEVKWGRLKRSGKRQEAPAGKVLTVVIDGQAPDHIGSHVMARAYLNENGPGSVRVFYNRVVSFGSRTYTGVVLGNILAHELTHVLQGVVQHSPKGLMKAVWDGRDYAEMTCQPLAFTDTDVALMRAHFDKQTTPAVTFASAPWLSALLP